MKNLVIFSLLYLIPIFGKTQSDAAMHTGNDFSPSESRYREQFFSPDYRRRHILEQSVCYFAVQRQQELDSSAAMVSTFYSAGETNGDFLPYEGSGSYDVGIKGLGRKDYGKYGILHGKTYYATGKHREISWNAMRFPELYLPYIITDSTGGDSRFETYFAEGGYTNMVGRVLLGADFSFRGEQAYRLTDPRLLNNTTFLTFKAGVGYLFETGGSVSFDAYYTRNKQYEHNRYWRPGEQQRFFVLHGFGLYNNKQSVVAFGVSRMYYINNGGFSFSYLSSERKEVSLIMNVNYDFKYMYTEESSIVNLYESYTHTLSPMFCLDYRQEGLFSAQMFSFNTVVIRRGCENIMERYVTDVANSIYDYRKIAEEKNYCFRSLQSHTGVKANLKIAGRNKAGVLAGISLFERREENSKYKYFVENLNFTQNIAFDFKFLSHNNRHEVDVMLQYSKQIPHKNFYDVEIQNNSIQHLDFQTCFAPYAYYAAETDGLYCELLYTRKLKNISTGIVVRGFYVAGKRTEDAEYGKTIGYNSICSMISPQADVHNESWLGFATFVIF